MRDLASAHSACVMVMVAMAAVCPDAPASSLVRGVQSPARSRQISITRLLSYGEAGRAAARRPRPRQRPPCAQLSTLMTLIRKSERAAAPR